MVSSPGFVRSVCDGFLALLDQLPTPGSGSAVVHWEQTEAWARTLEVRNEHNVDARREMQFVHLNVPITWSAVATRRMPDIVVQKFTVDVYTHLKLSLCRCRHVWNLPDCWSLCDLVSIWFSLVMWENYHSEDDFVFFWFSENPLNVVNSTFEFWSFSNVHIPKLVGKWLDNVYHWYYAYLQV